MSCIHSTCRQCLSCDLLPGTVPGARIYLGTQVSVSHPGLGLTDTACRGPHRFQPSNQPIPGVAWRQCRTKACWTTVRWEEGADLSWHLGCEGDWFHCGVTIWQLLYYLFIYNKTPESTNIGIKEVASLSITWFNCILPSMRKGMDDTVLFKQRPAQNPQNFSDPQRSTPPPSRLPSMAWGGFELRF